MNLLEYACHNGAINCYNYLKSTNVFEIKPLLTFLAIMSENKEMMSQFNDCNRCMDAKIFLHRKNTNVLSPVWLDFIMFRNYTLLLKMIKFNINRLDKKQKHLFLSLVI